MKKIFLIAALALSSTAALAQYFPPMPVFPNVSNNGYQAQIWISNNNQNFVWCTGSLSMYMDGPENRVHTANVSISVPPRGFVNRTYTPNPSGRIRRISHSIFCH